jgi:hypothetical protein
MARLISACSTSRQTGVAGQFSTSKPSRAAWFVACVLAFFPLCWALPAGAVVVLYTATEIDSLLGVWQYDYAITGTTFPPPAGDVLTGDPQQPFSVSATLHRNGKARPGQQTVDIVDANVVASDSAFTANVPEP